MSAKSKKTQPARLSLETLDQRDVPSISNIWMSGTTLYVATTAQDTQVTLNPSGSSVKVVEGGSTRTWTYSGVSSATVYGYDGNDRLISNLPTLPVELYGYGGNDFLMSYNGNDVLEGGYGNDIIQAYGGNDTLSGGPGQDRLCGMIGDDTIMGDDGDDVCVGGDGSDFVYGNNGHDSLIGGAGVDLMYGGAGNDSLVTIDTQTTDHADGQDGIDSAWRDSNFVNSTFQYDTTWVEKVHNVMSFANGADRTLNGDNFVDPTDGTFYKNFSNQPLFNVGGPVVDDVDQESTADCWALAPLGSLALDNPNAVRHMVADFGDGTYGVKLGNNFYRVDADLPTWNAASTDQVHAGLGTGGSLWVALVEKAYARHHTGANTYASMGWGDPIDAYIAYNLSSIGASYFAPAASGTAVANNIYSHWNAYQSCSICTGAVPNGSPLVGAHCYSVISVSRDTSGNVTSILVRNPWGADGTGGDPYITLTPAQLAACDIYVRWGNS